MRDRGYYRGHVDTGRRLGSVGFSRSSAVVGAHCKDRRSRLLAQCDARRFGGTISYFRQGCLVSDVYGGLLRWKQFGERGAIGSCDRGIDGSTGRRFSFKAPAG